jgi:hypothetical protein
MNVSGLPRRYGDFRIAKKRGNEPLWTMDRQEAK